MDRRGSRRPSRQGFSYLSEKSEAETKRKLTQGA